MLVQVGIIELIRINVPFALPHRLRSRLASRPRSIALPVCVRACYRCSGWQPQGPAAVALHAAHVVEAVDLRVLNAG